MDLAVKDERGTSMGEIAADLTDGEMATDSQTLRNQQLALQNELKDAMNDGLIGEVVRLHNLLSVMPIRIKTAEVAEIQAALANGNARLAEIKEDFAHATSLRNQKHQIYLEKLKIMEDAGTDILKVDVILTTLENEAENIRQARREFQSQLNNLMTGADA